MRYFLIACLLFLFQSCLDKDQIPPHILSKKKMQAVLWDMLRADEFVAYYAAKDSTMNKSNKNIDLYEQIFRMHNITKNEFKKSLDFYQARPDLLKVVLDSMSSRERLIMEKQYRQRPDTIKKQIEPVEY